MKFPPRRGIEPDNLLGLVRNTAPFIFETDYGKGDAAFYLRNLKEYRGQPLDHHAYFLFCLCAHWATAGTFVPTDVDNAIRLKLWQLGAPLEILDLMADRVLEAGRWDYRPVTARLAMSPSGAWVSTHEGTWFSVAVGAYAALKDRLPAKAEQVLGAMETEARRESALYAELLEAGDGLEILRACALLAHNFGDLDRVIDMWALPPGDALRRALYDAASPGSTLLDRRPAHAGALNQLFMAPENHRHLALREARFLRKKADLLLPVGPFFDAWGERVGRQPAEDVSVAVCALLDGWQRLPKTVGYARALAGIQESFPGGMERLSGLIPARDVRLLKAGTLRALTSISRQRFEAQWARFPRRLAASISGSRGSPRD